MEFTNNPTVGGNPGTWGTILNAILDELKTGVNTLESSKANTNHNHNSVYVAIAAFNTAIDSIYDALGLKANLNHDHNTVYATITALNSAINTINTALADKSNINHDHNTVYATITALNSAVETLNTALDEKSNAIAVINNTLDLLVPDLTSITVSAAIRNVVGGLNVVGLTVPAINVTSWRLLITKNSSTVFSGSLSSNYFYIFEQMMPGVSDDDMLEITIMAVSGNSTKSETYTHQYEHVLSSIESRMTAFENSLTVANIVTAFKNDTNAMQELANSVHGSNVLAQKVAELNA